MLPKGLGESTDVNPVSDKDAILTMHGMQVGICKYCKSLLAKRTFFYIFGRICSSKTGFGSKPV